MVKIFQREQRSLFGEILDWMLTPLLLLCPISLVLTWLVAQGIASLVDQCAAWGLVRREPDPLDARAARLLYAHGAGLAAGVSGLGGTGRGGIPR